MHSIRYEKKMSRLLTRIFHGDSMKQKQGHHEGHEEHEGGNAAGFNHRWTQIGMITKVWLSLKRLGDMVSA